ncbi:methyl-accepting chemotaxis protein [Pseudomonas aeruginosa]|uniref:DUF1631 family protein n=1 Tax=Pseudomonas aeruginosa TaxID=287 RepID=UPI001150A2FD|nr:methyl-accepting chemotaxis protein [Pseudomonas aeruginosa]TQG16801.1 DUF1631 family protein [Pseudomonas aeruginosa]
MQNDANVVHLTRVASEPSPNAGAGRLPVILVQVRDKAALQLKQALQALFDNADDTLFEMADRATSNLEQNAFFEAMRDLRLKRKSIERVYLQKVFEEFSALNQVQSGKSVPTLDTVSFDSLSLVQNEELEESVAVDAMVARVMSRDATALAKRTQQSTAEIEQMILRLQGGVDAAVKAMGSSHHTADGTVNESAQVQQALENILGAVGMIVDQNQQIAAAAEQQTAVAHDIDQNIVEINQAGERTAEGASQTERASRELGAQVTQLKRLIGAFRV